MTQTFSIQKPIWCAGCGHFGVLAAVDAAFERLGIPRHEGLVLAGIGCSGTIQNHLPSYGYHALHGRVVPSAIGAKLANPKLCVVAAGGDGDGFAIGGGHLMHALRSNVSVAYIVMNNQTYGLTKGQPSPTNPGGFQGQRDLDSIMLGLSLPGSTFLARGYSGWPEQLARLMDAALNHTRAGQGFAFLEVISPCVTYEDNYQQWSSKLYDVDEDSDYDATDRVGAFEFHHRLSSENRLPAGLIFRGRPKLREAREPTPPPLDGLNISHHMGGYRKVMNSFVG